MSALTSLLVRDQRVPVRTIEEAIQRQVISGGSFDTILLELAAIPENEMAAYCAAVFQRMPATRAEVMSVERAVIRLMPREVAENHRIVPLEIRERTLSVAVSEPLTPDTEVQLGVLLGAEIVQRVVPEVRLAAGLQFHYGIEMVPRMRRLSAKLEARDAGEVPYVAPLAQNTADRQPESVDYGRSEGEVPESEGPDTRPFEPLEPGAQAMVHVAEARVVGAQPESPAPPAESAPPRREPAQTRLSQPQSVLLRRHRGPLTARRSVELLEKAESRNEILEIAFAFVRQFFDFTAVFVVSEGQAEGLDAVGEGGPPHSSLQQISIPLDAPSSMALTCEGANAIVTKLDNGEEDRGLRSDLRRDDEMPAVLLPVAIRGRVVIVFYGDRSGEDFGLADIPELLAFAPRLSEAFQRLILRRKFRGYQETESVAKTSDAKDAAGADAGAHAAENTPSEGRAPRLRKRSDAMNRLGIPRSAPPPPSADAVASSAAPLEPAPLEPAPVPAELRIDERAGENEDIGEDEGATEEEIAGEDDFLDGPETEPAPPPDARPQGEAPRSQGQPTGNAFAHSASNGERSAGVYSVHSGRAEVIRPRPRSNTSPPSDPEPRAPQPSPRPSPSGPAPSVIVSMGDHIESAVEDLTKVGPDDDAAVQRVLSLGEAALPVIVQRFPGGLWFDRRAPHQRLPHGHDVGPLARAMVRFGELSTPYVASLLDHGDPDTRFYALLVAAELPHRDLVMPVARKVFDPEETVAAVAIELLGRLAHFEGEMAPVIDMLRATARTPRGAPLQRAAAVAALGELRDAGSLELLIQLLDAASDEIVGAAHEALVMLTRQDFGLATKRWAEWAKRHSRDHRVLWLIDGLSHEEERLREAAGAELKLLTQEYYGFHPTLPKKERDIVQRKYRDWWDTTGRARFGA